MKEIKIESEANKTFHLFEDDASIGYMEYENQLSSAATIHLENKATYNIDSEGLLNKTYNLTGSEINSFYLKYKLLESTIEISTSFGDIKNHFRFIMEGGLLNMGFVLFDNNGRQVLTVIPEKKFLNLGKNYIISANEISENDTYTKLMYFTVAYCIKLILTTMAAVI